MRVGAAPVKGSPLRRARPAIPIPRRRGGRGWGMTPSAVLQLVPVAPPPPRPAPIEGAEEKRWRGPSQPGFVLHDLLDIGDRVLGRGLAGIAVLDLGLGELLDRRPLREVLEPDGMLLEERQRLGELGRAMGAVAAARRIGARRIGAGIVGP